MRFNEVFTGDHLPRILARLLGKCRDLDPSTINPDGASLPQELIHTVVAYVMEFPDDFRAAIKGMPEDGYDRGLLMAAVESDVSMEAVGFLLVPAVTKAFATFITGCPEDFLVNLIDMGEDAAFLNLNALHNPHPHNPSREVH